MVESILKDGTLYLFMDYANGGSLENIGRCLSEVEINLVIFKLLKGLKTLSKHRVVHRDLNQSNVLLHFPSL